MVFASLFALFDLAAMARQTKEGKGKTKGKPKYFGSKHMAADEAGADAGGGGGGGDQV